MALAITAATAAQHPVTGANVVALLPAGLGLLLAGGVLLLAGAAAPQAPGIRPRLNTGLQTFLLGGHRQSGLRCVPAGGW
jgi:hypothetical protein